MALLGERAVAATAPDAGRGVAVAPPADRSTPRRAPRTASWRTLTARHWAAVALALALGSINAAVGWWTGETPYFAVAATFFAGVVLFLSPFWNPVLYLAAAVHVLALGVVWLLDGMRFLELGVATGILGLAFVALVLWLFLRESNRGGTGPRRG